MKINGLIMFIILSIGFLFLSGCSQTQNNNESAASSTGPEDPMSEKGIGPVSELILSDIDPQMVEEGKKIYESKCTACHNPTAKLIGPPQKGVLDRRSPEWIMNLMLNTQEMLDKDPIAKQLLKEYNNIPMTNQGLSYEDARKVLEYLRTL
jgi:cytochrome c